MKKFFVFAALPFLVFAFSVRPVSADNGTSTVQKALENAKQFLDDLVTAKDENSGDDVSLRAQTFRQVLDLSEAEAKDFEFKLLAVDKDQTLDAWKKATLNGFDQAITYFDSEKDLVSSTAALDLAGIKKIAVDFKTWRDENYLPLVDQSQDFLLLKKEAAAIGVAQTRLSKIASDLKKISLGTPGSGDVGKMLAASKASIDKASKLNGQAYSVFVDRYSVLANSSSTASNASSTDADLSATSTEPIPVLSLSSASSDAAMNATSTNATSSVSSATSSDASAGTSNPPIVSIKDLVRSSLDNIRDAYQGFIDISNLVRKLLG